jgi:hypothetical protein
MWIEVHYVKNVMKLGMIMIVPKMSDLNSKSSNSNLKILNSNLKILKILKFQPQITQTNQIHIMYKSTPPNSINKLPVHLTIGYALIIISKLTFNQVSRPLNYGFLFETCSD